MTQSLPNSRAKRTTLGAAVVFGIVYLGALAFIFAPEGSLSSRSSIVQSSMLP